MSDHVAAIAVALFTWWFATGVVLLLDGLPRATYRRSLICASLVALAALAGISWSASQTTLVAGYTAFSGAIVVWGWAEMTFLMGGITGPRRSACKAQCGGARHFLHGIQAILHHEFLVLACLAVLAALTWNEPNRLATWTFLILWCMRQSSKLNLFLGVRNTGEEMLPEHLQYLRSFFRRRAMNPLFPLSILGAGVAMTGLVRSAAAGAPGSFDALEATLLASMLALGMIEHVMLMLPFPSTALWGWAMRVRQSRRGGPAGETTTERRATSTP
jgi:putative photosynthetic complex assembly protein 2